jgi:hypothetical protein
METSLLSEKYQDRLAGVLHCYDRLILTGRVVPFCYAQGMTHYLYQHDIRIFDYAQFAAPWRDEIRANAEKLAQEEGLTIEFIRKNNFRKENRIQTILKQRGEQPGLVHIFSAMEPCTSYQPWHDKRTGKTFLKPSPGKCLHYYFYFIDPVLGLCYVRVPTWCPFRLQVYCNGHSWLATQLRQKQVGFELHDNAFTQIADWAVANQLADQMDSRALHVRLDAFAQRYCPVIQKLHLTYQWSIWQAEYATDLVFKNAKELQAFYPFLLETLIHTVKPSDIATFLGRKLHGNYQGELGSRFNVRPLGTRLKHSMGAVSIKLYDKFRLILRIETTVNDVSFFPHYREVVHRDGQREKKWAKMQKTIYSLPALREVLLAANQRYLKFISEIETPAVGVTVLTRVTEPQIEKDHHYKGFNLLAEEDARILRTLLRGEFAISGLTSRTFRPLLSDKSAGQISRLLKRLRVHGFIKKVGKHYKYYLTDLGRQIATMALKIRELVVIPGLACSATA